MKQNGGAGSSGMPRRLILAACGIAAGAPQLPARLEEGGGLEEARQQARRNLEALRKVRVDRHVEPAFRFEA